MHAHVFRHVPFEGLGSIGPWLDRAGHHVTHTSFFESEVLPGIETIDWLIVMGGPMSVNDAFAFPWLVPEKRFIRHAIERGMPVLGICLGAQLIASAMGARVYPNRVKEIGWLPIQGIPSEDKELFRFPSSAEVFHWHGETFDLPSGAVRLAKSDGCDNQAFQLGRSVIGLQFHLETTPASARAIVAHCRHELIPAPCVQTEAQILAAGDKTYTSINRIMDSVLDYFMHSAAAPAT